ncbi:MAG: nicotinate-nucleotide adenylyltransferase, partial [Clostridiales bacterium]|nr:nicotinate-nucleotide adenylyltransferase [Clostridiales bacterium]
MKIGILGGTFNPIHIGHMEMASIAADVFGLDDVMLIPTGNPPHKSKDDILSKYERYELCLLSAAEYDNIFVSSIEIDRDGYTYTIDTLNELEKVYGLKDDIYFIIGGDTVLQLEKWREFKEVLKRCKFIAFGRVSMDESSILNRIEFLKNEYGAEIGYITADIMDIASSDLRDMIKSGESVAGFIPAGAVEYIN